MSTDLREIDAIPARARQVGIGAAIALIALVGVGLSLTIPLLSLEMERMGVSNTGIGVNTALAGIAGIIAVPYVPRVAARIGMGRMLALSIALVLISLILFKAVFQYWAWFPIRFVFSAALGALFVLSEYWISALAPPARRGMVMGIYATVLALGRAGFQTLGDLADRPSGMLTARFGAGLADALWRVLGREDIRITPLRPAPEIMAEKHFAAPLGLLESLLAVLERLAQDIMAALERRGAGGRAFEVSVFRSDGAVRRIAIETAQGMRDASGLMHLVRLKLEALSDPLDPGFGFDAVRLVVIRSEPMAERQAALDGGPASQAEAGDVASLVDRLTARFGRETVQRFVTRDTHDPVRAGGSVPFLSRHTTAPFAHPEPGQPPARPLTLFDPPQWIEALAEVPDGPPLRFRWRRVLHEVARAEGPERIAPEWWRCGNAAPATRDYYRIENAHGHRFWVFREGFYEDQTTRPRWFLHGLFA